jgi:phytoene synthase
VTLEAAYRQCRELHARHGRSYFLATRLLPAWKRRHVHALYGFARYADEIVDDLDRPGDRTVLLTDWSERFLAGLDGAPVDDPVLPAVLHTIEVFQLDRSDFALFLRSMAMDLTVTGYDTYEDLLAYMEGSAAVIGTMMLPILGAADLEAAREPARELGRAFQLTNFIRDVAEDLERGRVYLPAADMAAFGVTAADLARAAAQRRATDGIKRLIAFEVERAETHYRAAAPGIEMLEPGSRGGIRTAFTLYREILTEVRRVDFDVLRGRVAVPRSRQLGIAARCLVARR